MGTSTARRAPSSRVWRQAKTAATRYLAPESGPAVPAREVVRRYLTALGESPAAEGGFPAAFRLTRQAAQELGHFLAELQAGRSLADEAAAPALTPAVRAHALAAAWLPPDGSLEGAAARTALVSVLQEILGPHAAGREMRPSEAVRDFLARAVATRLSLDLGEVLEAAATSAGALKAGQSGLTAAVAGGLAALPPAPASGWRQLAGWTWITQALQGLLASLPPEPPP